MLTDGLLNFVGPANPLSLANLVAGASVRSNIIDLLGVGVGVAPTSIIGTRTLWGTDFGIDKEKAQIACATGAAFTSGGACTLNVQFQAAADTGVAGGYQPSTWYTMMETGAMALANLTASAMIARMDYPPAFPVSFQPRFIALNFVTAAGLTFTAGTIAYALLTMARDDYSAAFAAKNFAVV